MVLVVVAVVVVGGGDIFAGPLNDLVVFWPGTCSS